jgi:intein/homing endonuclease
MADESGRIAALASSTIGELAIAEPALAASAGSRPVQLEPRFGRAAPSEAGVEKRLLRSRVLGALMAERGWSKGELGWLHYQKRDFKAGFVSGLLYGDGSVQDSNGSISWRLGPADRAFLTDVQLVLQELGVRASVLARKPAGVAMLPDGRGGRQAYATRAMFELIISGRRQCERAAIALEVPPHHRQRWDSLMERYHNAAYRDPDTSKVVSIELDAVEDVWCLSEDVRRTLVAEGLTARRCSEISLAHREACNLAEIFLPNITSFEQFTEVSRILYKIQKATALLPHPDPSTQAIVHRNLRLGQSISGVLQATEEQRSWVGPGYEALRAFDAEWSRELGVRDSVKLTSVKPSGCRPWDALTATDQGILTLQELLADHRDGETWSELRSGARVIHDDGRTAAISRSFVNGESETVRIKLNYGLELVSTPEHPWWVEQHIDRSRELKRQPVGKWVRAKDIAVDDVLSVNPGVYQNTEHARLPRVPMTALRMRHDVGAIQQPETMTADLAWLIGYLWGDGAQSPARWRIRFTDERLENLQKAMRIVSEQFGLRGVITSKKNNGAFDLTFASAELWHWLIAQGVWKYAPGGGLDLIPEIVRRSASEDIVAFIAGLLDSDGWVGLAGPKSSLKTLLTTADQAFAKHVQHVALAVGLVFGRSVQQPETQSAGRWGRRPHVNMALSGHSTPTAVALLRRHSTRLSRMPAAVSIADGHLIIGKVVAVEAGERVPTYDIEVPDGNWFYAGAVKSHNTASLLPGVTPGIHGAYARHYIRRVRFGEHSPLVDMCRMRGYPVTYDIGLDGREDHTRFVVEFPAQAPEGTPIAGEMSAVEQLRWLTWAQREWADNQVSITVTFRDAEVPEIKAWLAEHYDREVKSVSFLRYEDHGFRLPPYEPISEEEYQRRVAAIRTIKGAVGVSLENELDPEECASGACPVR